MSKIHETIKSFLKKYNLDKSDLKYLVAFSGGFDSMCLLASLKKICKNEIIAIHLNHKWRGAESDAEEKNCQEFCEKIGVKFYSENLSPDLAHTETVAREARYNFFEKCAKIFNSNIIFTAHNKNDNAETLIYRITTGTGISGLQGISENRDIYYRPLLEINRTDIETYCKKNNLTPNNDSSNKNTDYKRNYIRAKVLPELSKVNPDVIEKINTLSQIAREETQIIEEYTEIILNKISDNQKLQTKKFLKQTDAIQKRIIYKMFLDNKLEYDRKKILKILDFIKEASEAKSGKICSLDKNLWIFTNTENIEVINNETLDFPTLNITKEGKYENDKYIFEIEKFTKPVKRFPKDEENVAYINLRNLPIDFEIRTRQDGDIIKPFGMKGTQKLKKYLNEKKIPNHKKKNLLLLTQDKEVLWVVGYGISDKIKVSDLPTHRISLKGK